jgi:hypothetical protein
VDDPPIFVGSPNCPAPPGCPVYGNEVNGIQGNTFTLTQATGTSIFGAADPLLLLIGVPNVADSYGAPGVTLSVGQGTLGGTPPNALPATSWNSTTGFANTMTSGGAINDAYQAIGLAEPWQATSGNSESFGNWAAADSAVLGLNVTNFGVYVYELTLPPVDANGVITGHGSSVDVTFLNSLQQGTFVVAYGCHTTTFPCQGKDVFSTPFTQAGLAMGQSTVNTPEPSMVSQLAVDLLGLVALVCIFGRGRFKRTSSRLNFAAKTNS